MGDSASVRFKPTLNPQQQFLRNDLINLLEGEIGKPFELGEFVPEANALQQFGFGAAADAASRLQFDPNRQEAVNRLTRGQPAFTVDPAQSEQQFQQIVGDPSRRAFQRDTIPALQEAFNARGLQRSGDFQRNLGEAGRDLELGLASQRGQFLRDDLTQGRQALESAAGRVPLGLQLGAQESTLPSSIALQAGGQQRQIQQQLGLQDLTNRLAESPFNNPALQFLTIALNPTLAGGQSSSQGLGGILGSVLGGVGGLAAGVAAL